MCILLYIILRSRPTTNFDQVPVMKPSCFNQLMFGYCGAAY